MKETHVVLRAIRASTRDLFLGPLAGVRGAVRGLPAEDTLTLEVDRIDRRDVAKTSQNADVVAIAPSVPMTLIAPAEVKAAPAGMPAWGVKAVGALESPFTGQGACVAVLDTGIDANHPAFAGVQLVTKDFTGEGVRDTHGHGTHCAGTIFGRSVGGQRIGVAQGVKKALIGKVLGDKGGSSENIVSAMLWAVENGAHVVSMSLGIDFPGLVKRLQDNGFPPELATSRALEGYRANVQLFERMAALIRARASFGQPTIIVAAAGNESRRPNFELAVAPPAVSEGIVSVAALGQVQQGLDVASFSNTGANVSGPGVDILSAKPGGGLQLMSGTSMATPHVAGVAALWTEKLMKENSLNMGLLTARLMASGVKNVLRPGFDPGDVGAGLVQAPLN